MNTEAILEEKRAWLARAARNGVEGVYRAQALALPLPPSLHDALRVPRAEYAVAAEMLRRCPRRGGSALTFDFSKVASSLHELGMTALSIRSDEHQYGGSYADILAAAQATPLPILCRDLILDPLQVTMARAHGASAVMLTAHVLGEDDFLILFRHASELGLEVVAEVQTIQEIEMVRRLRLGASGSGSVRIFCVSASSTAGPDGEQDVCERLSSSLPEHAVRMADVEEGELHRIRELEARGYEAFICHECPASVDAAIQRFSSLTGEGNGFDD